MSYFYQSCLYSTKQLFISVLRFRFKYNYLMIYVCISCYRDQQEFIRCVKQGTIHKRWKEEAGHYFRNRWITNFTANEYSKYCADLNIFCAKNEPGYVEDFMQSVILMYILIQFILRLRKFLIFILYYVM